MKKILIFLLIVLAAILFISNPDKSKHKEKIVAELKPAIMEILNKESKSNLASNIVSGLFSSQIDQVIERQIIVEDYIFFSLCKIKISEDETKPLGLGILNHVFLFVNEKDLKEAYTKKFINSL